MAEYTEDCCFNYHRDYCKGGECSCRCHLEVPVTPACGHEAEIERYRQKSRDEDTARIRLNHDRIEARDRADALTAETATLAARVAALERVIFQVRSGLGLIALGWMKDYSEAAREDARRIELAMARCDAALAATAPPAGVEG